MDETLKNDIVELFKKHPELKNRKLVFNDDDFAFGVEITDLLNKTDALTNCRQELELPDVIKGHSSKIEVRRSPVHGYGVFAKEAIEQGEFIEECRLIKMAWRVYTLQPQL